MIKEKGIKWSSSPTSTGQHAHQRVSLANHFSLRKKLCHTCGQHTRESLGKHVLWCLSEQVTLAGAGRRIKRQSWIRNYSRPSNWDWSLPLQDSLSHVAFLLKPEPTCLVSSPKFSCIGFDFFFFLAAQRGFSTSTLGQRQLVTKTSWLIFQYLFRTITFQVSLF